MVQLALATALHMAGRTSEARPVYLKALSVDHGNAAAANNLAYLYAAQKTNLDEALRLARLAVQKQPDNASYADTLASVYSATNMYDSAVQVMRTVVKKNPQSTEYRLQLARLLISSGKRHDANIELASVSKAGLNQAQQVELSQLLTEVR
jgi:Flp pilus assembly protein TadD